MLLIPLKNAVTSASGIRLALKGALQGPALLAAAGLALLAKLLTCIRMIRGPEVSDDLLLTLVCPHVISKLAPVPNSHASGPMYL